MNLTPLLIFHITAGGVALTAGATALLAQKGAWLHRTAGNAFFIAMLLMAVAGGTLAVLKPAAAAFNVIISAITIYMIATSWMTATRGDKQTGPFDTFACFAAFAIAGGAVLLGAQAMGNPKGAIPAALFFSFAAIAGMAALADVSVIMRGGVSGPQRIARHLWRMTLAMFLATLAFFVGQGAKIFPPEIRAMGLLPVPMLVVLALMLFWLWRVLFTNWWRQHSQ